ncbi:MAG: tyrosine-protein phosphatase [Dehalococcoidia bacterium]
MRPDIFWIGPAPTGLLAIMPHPRGGARLASALQALVGVGVRSVVSLLTDAEADELDLAHEAATCAALGLRFRHLPIADMGTPASDMEAAAVASALHDDLASGLAVAIHCRAGVGRSSTLAACVLALAGVPPDAAFARIAAARGCPVPETAGQRAWVEAFARGLPRP